MRGSDSPEKWREMQTEVTFSSATNWLSFTCSSVWCYWSNNLGGNCRLFLPPTHVVCGKIMFSILSVCLFTGGVPMWPLPWWYWSVTGHMGPPTPPDMATWIQLSVSGQLAFDWKAFLYYLHLFFYYKGTLKELCGAVVPLTSIYFEFVVSHLTRSFISFNPIHHLFVRTRPH